MASHGTDQLLVQRLLTCRNKRDSQKAIILSGFVVFLQFTLFLLIGVMLFAYYQTGATKPVLESNDQVFPFFIVRQLPHGVSGLVIAAIFAAAMSNLSGSLNSLSSSTVLDFYRPLVNPNASDDYLLRLSKWFTVGLGINSNRDCHCREEFHQVGTQHGAHDRVAALWRDARCVSARRADQTRESTRRDDRDGGRAGGDVVCVA